MTRVLWLGLVSMIGATTTFAQSSGEPVADPPVGSVSDEGLASDSDEAAAEAPLGEAATAEATTAEATTDEVATVDEDAEHGSDTSSDPHAERRVGGVSVYDGETEARFAWDDRDHERMGVLRIAFGMPYLVAIKYADGPLCEPTDVPEDQTFCARAGEPFLDLEAGFAVTHRLEIVGAVTVSLDDDPIALAKPRAYGIGLRGYTADEAIVKGFFGARLVLDHTPSDADDWSNVDFGVRGDFGIQVDPVRWLGIFVQGAVGVRLLRGFTFLPEASAGLQIRFP